MIDTTDFSKSLDELQGVTSENAEMAPTELVRGIIVARSKPMKDLRAHEIGQLVVQQSGFPFLLDLVIPILVDDPLFDGGYYPGDVLSNLIRAPERVWAGRQHLRDALPSIYQRALKRPIEEADAFRESLGLQGCGVAN